MAQRQQQEKVHRDSVKTMDTDYVRSKEAQIRARKRRKVIERRRMAIILTIAVGFCLLLTWNLFKQNDRLATKQAQQIVAEQQLAEVQEQQKMLKLQIAKLEDDEYIAKLARKEYFLSEKGEIIFTIPKQNDDSKNDKEEEKAD